MSLDAPQHWTKRGLVFQPDPRLSWMQSHAQLPTVQVLGEGQCRVYFAGRDADQRSHIGAVDMELSDPVHVSHVTSEPVLSPGPLGCFDEHGVYPASIVQAGDALYLYYIGWTRGAPQPLFYAAIGLAISTDGGRTFHRQSPAPVLARSVHDPCLVTSPCVWREGARWRMVYVSGLRWERHGEALHSYYHLKYAESPDGLTWERDGLVAVDFASPGESNIARASVVRGDGGYKMWYCHAHTDRPYRMGYATSPDGYSWTRNDAAFALDASDDTFDSDMQCYPAVFEHAGRLHMFYNGNAYGRDGFGLAVCEG